MRILIQQRLGRHDLPVLTKAALRNLLINPCLLQRVELTFFGDSFERGDLTLDGGSRRNTGASRYAIDYHGAQPALTKSATKTWPSQAKIIAQDIEQWGLRIDVQCVHFAVHFHYDVAHSRFSIRIRLGQRA